MGKVEIPKRLGIIAIVCLLVVATALGAGLGVGLVSSKDNPPTDPILEKEELEQHQRLHTMYRERFFDIVGESVVKEGTPESHAAVTRWHEAASRRFMLAVFYFSATDIGEWPQCPHTFQESDLARLWTSVMRRMLPCAG